MSEGRTRRLIHGNGKANAVLCEVYRSVIAKRELSSTEKLSFFKSVLVPMLTYGHESWAVTEAVLFQVQAAEMAFLRRADGVAQRGKVRSCEIRKAVNTEPFLRRSPLRWFDHVTRSVLWLHPR